jgi:hypothetical protein
MKQLIGFKGSNKGAWRLQLNVNFTLEQAIDGPEGE